MLNIFFQSQYRNNFPFCYIECNYVTSFMSLSQMFHAQATLRVIGLLQYNAEMALTHLAFTLLIMVIVEGSEANKTGHNAKPTLDIKRRSNIVDEAFLEQKEILLDMLESKLKEVRDKKKKKSVEGRHYLDALERDKCQSMLKNVNVNVKINGISAIGEADLKLKYGNSSKGFININSTGISNVGQATMELGVGDSAVFIPGLSNIFIDHKLLDCANKKAALSSTKEKSDETKIIEDNNKNNNAQVDAKPDASPAHLSEIVPTTASRVVDSVIPTTSTPFSLLIQPLRPIVPPSPLSGKTDRTNQLPIAQAMLQESPQAKPQTLLQAIPQTYPQAVPQPVP